jgi:hypothetical protein
MGLYGESMTNYEISTNNDDKRKISNCREFSEFINEINERWPVICYLEYNNDLFISIGVSKDYGFFQYSSKSSNDLSIIATKKPEIPSKIEYLEFDCGGTPTPIHFSRCLDINLVIQIVCDYIKNGSLPNYVQWEKV